MKLRAQGGLEFRPMQGLIGIGERIASQFPGFREVWEGEDGLRAVTQQKLKELGVPDKPIPLTSGQKVTPRSLAEHAGFIKRRKRLKG